MRVRSLLLCSLAPLSLALSWGCGGADLGDCPSNSQAEQAQGLMILDTTCAACHSTKLSGKDRNGAPSDINLDDKSYVQSNASDIYGEVKDGSMPPGGGLQDAQKEAVRAYLACTTK